MLPVVLLDDSRMVSWVNKKVESLQAIVHMGHIILDRLIKGTDNRLRSLSADDFVAEVPADVVLEQSDHVKPDGLVNQLYCLIFLAGLETLKSTLEEESFTKSSGKVLNILVKIRHPNLEECLLLLENQLFQLVEHLFELNGFSCENQVLHHLEAFSDVLCGLD